MVSSCPLLVHLQSVGRGVGVDAQKGALNFLKGATPSQDMMGGVDGGTGFGEVEDEVVAVESSRVG